MKFPTSSTSVRLPARSSIVRTIAEPRALIGFAGPRVIAETIRQPLPEGFQRSEFLLEHGQLDLVVERRDLKETLRRLLAFFADQPTDPPPERA